MLNPRLASRYAQSLLEIAQEQNVLEVVLRDMQLLEDICNASQDFKIMLRSPVIKGDKKMSIIKAVLGNSIDALTASFIELLTRKGREYFLDQIAQSYIKQYKKLKNIHTVRLKTAVALDATLESDILQAIKRSVTTGDIELQTSVEEDLIGGFVLELEDTQFDASIKRDLHDIKMQFSKNLYIAQI